tara:strand:+ start:9496 stop:9990 length:495 start_codon:yes stop_codon:yes gene_type:complete
MDKKEKKKIMLPPHVIQIYMKKAGMYCSGSLGTDTYYLFSLIDILIGYIEEKEPDYMKTYYPEYNAKFKKKMEKIRKSLHKLTLYYDSLQDKTLTEDKKEKKLKEGLFKHASKIALIQTQIHALHSFLINSTNIDRMTIPKENIKILEHKNFGKIETAKVKEKK